MKDPWWVVTVSVLPSRAGVCRCGVGVEPGGRGLVGGVGTLLGPEESGRPECSGARVFG